MLRYLSLFFLFVVQALPTSAQQFGMRWVADPMPDSLAHVWFRHTSLADGRPQWAHLDVATTGLVKVYVNEAKVGTALFYPSRQTGDTTIQRMTFDVTPYLRGDTNVVAVLFSPGFPHATRRQVAVNFYGQGADGEPFCFVSDGSWLCRRAASGLTPDGHEWVDGRMADTPWTATTLEAALWRSADDTTPNVLPTPNPSSSPHSPSPPSTPSSPSTPLPPSRPSSLAPLSEHATHRWRSLFFDPFDDGVTYDFGTAFRGLVRLNLRQARWGEQIEAAGNIYICNGHMDEQACPVFGITTLRRVTVTGDRNFQRDQITEAEAVETQPTPIDNIFQ